MSDSGNEIQFPEDVPGLISYFATKLINTSEPIRLSMEL